MNTPQCVDVAITNKCNLRCRYCGYFTSASDVNKDLPKEEWLKFFEELSCYNVMNIKIQGGEPFCQEDLRELIEGIVRNRMRFSILSNGTLITDEMAVFLASSGRCNGVQVSIDGSIPMTHDVCRGKGSFIKAIAGIKYLQKHLVPVTVRVTIHKQNVRDIEGIARLLLEEIGLSDFSTNAVAYMGVCRQDAEQIQLTTKEYFIAMNTLLRLNKKYNGRISAMAGPLAEVKRWREMERARKNGKEYILGRSYLAGCGGIMYRIAIRADGVIVPCIHLSHIELGRITQDDIKEVWQNHPELKRLRERRNIPLSDFKFCQGCDYVNFCSGGCPAIAYTILGNEYHPSPDACLRKFLYEGGRLPDEELFFVQGNKC